GEKVPIDGIILSGSSSLNTAALTGESLPRDAKEGDEVISGCINMTGVLKIQTTKEFGESTVSKILDLVENASSRKSKSEDFISKFARVYTPAVVYSAIALAILPPLVRIFGMGLGGDWGTWIYRALTFLVISCPCALVISIPLSFFAGIGGASKEGVLIKGSNYMESLSQTKYVVMDKTGTLTQGVFEVTGIHHNKLEEEKILEYAALAESASSHPISKSIQRAYGKEIDRSRVTDIQEISGNGVTAKVDGVTVAAGNDKLMKSLGIAYKDCHHVGTIIHMALDGEYAGHIVIADIVKPHSKQAIAELKKAGVEKTVMLTGDSKRVAEKVAADLGLDEVYSELLPSGKVEKVEELIEKKSEKAKLAFVGDGINDAPVLSRADIGIAMGAMGSDAAIEAADIVLMDDDPLKISKAIKISKKCIRIVYENIWFAIGIKLICLLLGALGIANMWAAIFADVGVMVIAVLNAIRALFTKKL
ncbi:MAG: heavy metal translocating P-type ATPase, partial [Roseburia sp.]|nr:heavy metal translocating P-type ATPase [Roseburia sp.]